MGRRRRRVIRIVKKKLPTVFVCPRCGEEAVRVTIAKDTGHATVLCALCNLKDDFPAHPAAQPIDVYSYFTDRFYGVKDPRPIIPHDRPLQAPSPEEETVEDAAPGEATVSEPAKGDLQIEKPEVQAEPSIGEEPAQSEVTNKSSIEQAPMDAPQTAEPGTSQNETETGSESESESKEEREPFADILENKDKKRYSSTPLPQQTSEHTN